jgi:hypothetical protein
VNLPKGSVSLAIVGTRPRRKVPGNNFSNFKVCQEMLGFSALGYKIIRNHWKKKKAAADMTWTWPSSGLGMLC